MLSLQLLWPTLALVLKAVVGIIPYPIRFADRLASGGRTVVSQAILRDGPIIGTTSPKVSHRGTIQAGNRLT